MGLAVVGTADLDVFGAQCRSAASSDSVQLRKGAGPATVMLVAAAAGYGEAIPVLLGWRPV